MATERAEPVKASLVEDALDERLQQLVTVASGVGSTRGEVCRENVKGGIQDTYRSFLGNAGVALLFEAASRKEGKV